jgi:hypothetical protein
VVGSGSAVVRAAVGLHSTSKIHLIYEFHNIIHHHNTNALKAAQRRQVTSSREHSEI